MRFDIFVDSFLSKPLSINKKLNKSQNDMIFAFKMMHSSYSYSKKLNRFLDKDIFENISTLYQLLNRKQFVNICIGS